MPQDQDDIKGADAMKQAPTPGPLDGESVKLLVKGDLLRCISPHTIAINQGEIRTFDRRTHREPGAGNDIVLSDSPLSTWSGIFAFIGRPDADGWMSWSGGENPVPGQRVETRLRNGRPAFTEASDGLSWSHDTNRTWADHHIIAFRLSPTAPVDASGSEREHAFGDFEGDHLTDGNGYATAEVYARCRAAFDAEWSNGQQAAYNAALAALRPQPSETVFTPEHKRRAFDLARPQPSGETREAVIDIVRDTQLEISPDPAFAGLPFMTEEAAADTTDAILAALRPAPVASGGQHSSGEVAAWAWLNGHVECDPADRDYSADEMVDAFMAGTGRYDLWAKALERIAGEHQQRSGYCQTDITVEPALTAEEAQTVARDALSGSLALYTAPVAETAGEAVAWQWRHGDDMDWHTSGVRHAWFDDEALNPRFRLRALYAAPVPAQDDDKLRIAADALRMARTGYCVLRTMTKSKGLLRGYETALEHINTIDDALAALKAEGK